MDPEVNELAGFGEMPLAFRMMEHFPSLSASLGFANMRGSNTLLRGGFMDDRKRGPGKLGGFQRGALTPTNPTANAYYGSRARRARLAQSAGSTNAKMAFGKGARVNHITARPRALSRYSSLTAFNASQNTPFYSPFQMMSKVGDYFGKRSQGFLNAVYGSGTTVSPEENMFQRGTLSMITAGRKADLFEAKAKFNPDGTAANRAGRRTLKAQEQVRRLSLMNNPNFATNRTFSGGQFGRVLPRSLNAGTVLPAGQTLNIASGFDNALAGGQRTGLTGNLMASAGSSQASRFVQGYFRGALGFAEAGGLTDDALRGARQAVSHLDTAIFNKLGSPYAGQGAKALEQGVFKTLGGLKGGYANVAKVAATKQGAMVLGARTAAMAIPGLNVLATASLVYDLGKMGGEIVKSGINLAKDAAKSMKGSIDKPMFGMGYKDNEIAATSRARGVMAIQNSRLNARSMLGSEGAMMAAHFG